MSVHRCLTCRTCGFGCNLCKRCKCYINILKGKITMNTKEKIIADLREILNDKSTSNERKLQDVEHLISYSENHGPKN